MNGRKQWTKEEMMAYLDFEAAEDSRIEARVAMQLRDNPFTSNRGMQHIWADIEADRVEQEALFLGS